MTKTDKVKQHIWSGKTLTGLQAIHLYNYYRLSSLMNRLRDKGWPIETIMVRNGSRSYGKYMIQICKGKNIKI